jgi:hypothetical protein
MLLADCRAQGEISPKGDVRVGPVLRNVFRPHAERISLELERGLAAGERLARYGIQLGNRLIAGAGRADALALDDILLYGPIAGAGREGADYHVLSENLSYEPYGITFRKNDPVFAAVVTGTFKRLAQSREIRWSSSSAFSK